MLIRCAPTCFSSSGWCRRSNQNRSRRDQRRRQFDRGCFFFVFWFYELRTIADDDQKSVSTFLYKTQRKTETT